MNIKEFLLRELNKYPELVEPFQEEIEIEDEGNNVYSTGEIILTREVIIDFLTKSGYEINQNNFDMAKQLLESMDSQTLRNTLVNVTKSMAKKYKTVNHLDDMTENELNTVLNVALLNTLKKNINYQKSLKYEYAVEAIKDINGKTDLVTLKKVLDIYSNKGYRVVNIFTNEVGKNSRILGNVEFNSTADQIVIVFEKPVFE